MRHANPCRWRCRFGQFNTGDTQTMNHRANYKLLGIAALAAATLAVSSPAVRAQNVVAASDTEQETSLNEVIVTGTRTTGLEAAESPAPIQILSPAALEAASGNPDLMQTLAQIVPSLTGGGDRSHRSADGRSGRAVRQRRNRRRHQYHSEEELLGRQHRWHLWRQLRWRCSRQHGALEL